MTPEAEKKRREVFEAVYPFSGLYVFTADGRYVSQQLTPSAGESESLLLINEAWLYWNKALDAVEIKNPFAADPYDPDSAWASVKMNEAITATGLGLRIK